MRKMISASMLAADRADLGTALRKVVNAGVDRLHWDCMDGSFVPNLGFDAATIKACRALTTRPFDVHLMVRNPDAYLQMMAEAGADTLIIHPESTPHWHRTLSEARRYIKQVGLALNPTTPIEVLEYALDLLDVIVVMTVNPGFGGQQLIPSQLYKIKKLQDFLRKNHHGKIQIHVDGGITLAKAPSLWEAGADVLVTGTSIFQEKNYTQAIAALKETTVA